MVGIDVDVCPWMVRMEFEGHTFFVGRETARYLGEVLRLLSRLCEDRPNEGA